MENLYATVNGSNSTGNCTIEAPHDVSESIGRSAYLLVFDGYTGKCTTIVYAEIVQLVSTSD